MRCLLALSLVAVVTITVEATGQPRGTAPAYTRHRGDQGYRHVPNYRHHAPRGPAVAAGTYQRPYPYHLDYYKQRYGGSYEPYFGNLYGPPNVVLGAPYGYYGPQVYGAPYAQAPQQQMQSPQPTPQTQTLVCPHCGQALYLVAPVEQEVPASAN